MKLRHFPFFVTAFLMTPTTFAALAPGDIAFTGFNADGNDNLAFVALADIAAGEAIIFEDNEWNGTAWVDTNENAFVWTASSTVTAGTIVTLDSVGIASPGLPTASTGTIAYAPTGTHGLNRGIGGGDETIYAYQGTRSSPTFIAAVTSGGFITANGVLTGTGLTAGTNASELNVRDDDGDIFAWIGSRAGYADWAAVRAAINASPVAGNWSAQDASGDQSADGTVPDVPFSVAPFSVGGTVITLTVSSTSTSFSESAANPASIGTVTRDGGTAASLLVNLASNDATEAAVPATVTIPINQTSVNFDITAVDDSFPDGSKTPVITASAAGATDGTLNLTVTDDGDVITSNLMLTEILSNQSAGNTVVDEDYWELTNFGSNTIDLTGYSWSDSAQTPGVAFPSGTTINAGESVIFTATEPTAFRTWWNLPNTVKVIQSATAPGLGSADGVSFFDNTGNKLFFFSYAANGFTREDGSLATGGHAGPSAGAALDQIAMIWVPTSPTTVTTGTAGPTPPRYTFATGSNYGSKVAATNADLGSPGNTVGVSSVSIASAAAAEGNSGTSTLALNVTRSDTTTAFTIDYAVTGGTADTNDFTLASGTLSFTANGPAVLPINISVNGDTVLEGNETVIITLSNLVNTIGATVLGTATGTGTIVNDETAAGTINLATYVRTGRYNLPEPTRTALPPGTASHNLLCQEASAVTYNWDTDTLFISCDGGRSVTQVSKTGALIDTMSLDLQSGAPQGTAFYDPEGITYIGGGQFVLSEERDQQLVKFTYAAGTTLTRAAAQTVDLGPFDDNTGTEGLSWDPPASNFIVLKEKSPIGVFLAGVDFTAGTTTTAPPVIGNESSNLFNTALLGMTDVADVFAFSNLPAMASQPQEGNLLVLGQENARVVNISRSGVIASTLNITADPGDTISSPNMQHEGITMDRDGNIYIVNENGGGDINFPQLWVYSTTSVPNAAPSAVALNNAVVSIQENTSTASPVKVGDIAITDDGLGTNDLSLSGVDSASFQITGSSLFLKAGVTLDFETKTSYSATINVDDTSVGSTPDASVNFTLTVTDQLVETPAVAALLITEVSPWSSGNSPVAGDWFEVTNVTDNPVTITDWKVDDSSAAFATALTLNGITTIAPGESVIFVEGTLATADAFKSNWFGASPPSGLQVGYYSGSGIGLSTGGDGVNLFNAGGTLQASVSFGAADATSPYQTFDNTVALNNASISLLSVAGVNGAFVAANSAVEIGSPGFSAPGVLRVTEVAPWSSGNSPVAADWFEVTNSGARAVNIAGWKVDDSSESPAAALALNGITSIAPGESVIFIETADLPGKSALFKSTWFGANPPAGLQIGSYSGSGIGLSTGGDAVNLYDTTSPTPVRRVNVSFGIAPSSAPFASFDNTAAVNVGAVTLKSVPGVNGAFIAANDPNEAGSPGTVVSGGPLDFALWLAGKGYASFGPGTDSDRDGVTDGVEFFFNQNPNNGGDFGNMPQLVPNAGGLELDFTRLTSTGPTTGTLEVSCDLQTWTDALLNIDYTVASSVVTGDETAFTYALPGTGPSAPGVSPTYFVPNNSDPVGASLGGVRVVNEGLVGVGRLSGDSLDSFGETQGAASGLFITGWGWNGSQFNGTFNVLPDRGHGDGTSNYAARLHKVNFSFTPYYGTPLTVPQQGQVVPTYVESTKFTYQDGPTVKFTTGLNPTGTSNLFNQTVGTITTANGPGGTQETLLSFDTEAVHLFADGSGYVSDEYGTYIARFDATKKITGLTQLPGAAQPYKNGVLNFDSGAAPTTGRRNNQGLEGMSVTPDGTLLFAMLQSATVQDSGSTADKRNNARVFVYNIVGANRENPVLVGEYVVKLPQIDLNSDGSGADGTAAQSEIVALNNSSFLMLPRDGNGLGKLNSAPILLKSVQLVDFASATNIRGEHDGVGQQISPAGVLRTEIKAAATAEVINMLQSDDLAKFGLNKTLPANSNTLNEKIEGMALVPDISTPAANDFFLFIANDNDFQSSNVMMLNAAGAVASKGNGQVGGVTNDAMFYVYRLTIDAGGKKFFRFGVE